MNKFILSTLCLAAAQNACANTNAPTAIVGQNITATTAGNPRVNPQGLTNWKVFQIGQTLNSLEFIIQAIEECEQIPQNQRHQALSPLFFEEAKRRLTAVFLKKTPEQRKQARASLISKFTKMAEKYPYKTKSDFHKITSSILQ